MTDPLQAFLQTNGLASAPFAPGSRYHGLPTAEHTRPDGSVVAFVKRRFVPPPASFALIQEHEVVAGDRLDNLAAHKIEGARTAVEAVGARLLFLPPYSPDLNPIENAFAKLKALLRKAAARTVDQLWEAIAQIIQTYSPAECANYFSAAGYDAD